MKPLQLASPLRKLAPYAFALLLAPGFSFGAPDEKDEVPPKPDNRESVRQGSGNYYPEWNKSSGIPPTSQDWPGSVTKYYGERPDEFKDAQREIAKVEIQGDFNYDGVISHEDPGDHGAFKRTPPGLILGVGELSKLIIYVEPYRVDFQADAVISLEAEGINRAVASGAFKNIDEEIANTSRIRIWKDPRKKELLLDSHSRDPKLRRIEWKFDNTRMAPGGAVTGMNLPFQPYPRTVYIEGVNPHGKYLGDVRILLACENGSPDNNGPRRGIFKRFRTTWNHFLCTVTEKPMEKEFVVPEALQDVWITPGRRNSWLSEKE